MRRHALIILMIAGCRYHFEALPADANGGDLGAATDAMTDAIDGPLGPISFVQNSYLHCGAVIICTETLQVNVEPGSMIIVTTTYDNLATTFVVTDSANDTFVQAVAPLAWNTSALHTGIWYARHTTTSASISVSVHYTPAPTSFADMYTNVYANVTAVDQIADSTGIASAPSSGFQTTAFPDEVIFGHGEGMGATCAAGPGFAVRNSSNANTEEDKVASTPGTYDANFNIGGPMEFVALMLTLR